ncbi:MAG: hypothetical protein OXM88_12825 [bacterium]|nr:hypothetical protein [bacterium]
MYDDGTEQHCSHLEQLLPLGGQSRQTATSLTTVQVAEKLNVLTRQMADRDPWSQESKKLESAKERWQKVYTYRVAYDLLIERSGGGVIRPGDEPTFPPDLELAPGVVISTDPLAPTVVAGPKKHGKSTLARYVATELVWNDHKVAVIVGEGMREWSNETRCYAVGLRPLLVPMTADPNLQDHYKAAMDEHGTTAVILDPLGEWMDMLKLTEGYPSHSYKALSALRQWVDPDKLMVIVHHENDKGGLRGGGTLGGIAGVQLSSYRHEDRKAGKDRYEVRVEEWRGGNRYGPDRGEVKKDDENWVTVVEWG